MMLLIVVSALMLWAGLTLLLAEFRWFSRRSLADRLAPYVPGGMGRRNHIGILSVESFREAVGPLARSLGAQFSRLFGVSEDLDRRLRRVHADLDVTEFRVRQIGWALAGFGAGTLLAIAATPNPAIML